MEDPRPPRADGRYDDPVTDPPDTDPTRGETPTEATSPAEPTPGERRLAHPPSDRYRAAEAAEADAIEGPDPSASVARGVAFAVVVGIVGAVVTVVLGGVITFSAGLLVVAATTGFLVGLALRVGAADRLVGSRRVWIAIVVALLAIALGQLGLWLYARTEGGVLSLIDYLGAAFGPLVPLQFVAAAIGAWLAAR